MPEGVHGLFAFGGDVTAQVGLIVAQEPVVEFLLKVVSDLGRFQPLRFDPLVAFCLLGGGPQTALVSL